MYALVVTKPPRIAVRSWSARGNAVRQALDSEEDSAAGVFHLSQISFRQQHVNALVAIDQLRHTKVAGVASILKPRRGQVKNRSGM